MTDINIWVDCIGIAICLTMLFGCIIVRTKNDKQYNTFFAVILCMILILICDLLTLILDGKPYATVLLYILYFLVFSFAYIMLSLFTYYMMLYFPKNKKSLHLIAVSVNVICLIAILLVVISLFNNMYFSIENGVYHRGPLFWLSHFFFVIVFATDLITAICFSKKLGITNTIAIISYGLFPACAVFFQSSSYGTPLIYIATTLSLLIVYTTMHGEQNLKKKQLENELTQSKISLMLSQIQPHFLYNSLGVIQDLCHNKAPEAEQATIEFTEFLRCNVDSLSSDKPISFEKELNHTKNYLHLESRRFGERLNVVLNIKTTDFYVPALTLQPAVENAVRYGIMKRENGGTIKISSFETESDYRITVEDDGVGFDLNETPSDDRLHIGISNVRNRIKTMCGGSLMINSKPDVGTVTTFIFPKGENKNEHYSSR